jgi:putative copper resistance protein D
MIEPGIVTVRLLQFLGAMVLTGSSFFFVYALPGSGAGSAAHIRWARPLLGSAAVVLVVASLLAIPMQATLFSGSLAEGFTSEAMGAVVSYMDMGKAALARAGLASAALVLLWLSPPGRARWPIVGMLGAAATASLAWMGHGAATEGALGWLHLVSDILHVLAAAVWIGALLAFLLLSLNRRASAHQNLAFHSGLSGFSGVGSAVVAVLIVTGLINGWVLVGPAHVEELWTTPYGRLLSLKLLLFSGMLALALANRVRLTPAFGRTLHGETLPEDALLALRRSLALETGLSVGVLLLVAWLGTLEPPASL